MPSVGMEHALWISREPTAWRRSRLLIWWLHPTIALPETECLLLLNGADECRCRWSQVGHETLLYHLILGYEKYDRQRKILEAETTGILNTLKEVDSLIETPNSIDNHAADLRARELQARVDTIEQVLSTVRRNPMDQNQVADYYFAADDFTIGILLSHEKASLHQDLAQVFLNIYVQAKLMFHKGLAAALQDNDHIVDGMTIELCLISPVACH